MEIFFLKMWKDWNQGLELSNQSELFFVQTWKKNLRRYFFLFKHDSFAAKRDFTFSHLSPSIYHHHQLLICRIFIFLKKKNYLRRFFFLRNPLFLLLVSLLRSWSVKSNYRKQFFDEIQFNRWSRTTIEKHFYLF